MHPLLKNMAAGSLIIFFCGCRPNLSSSDIIAEVNGHKITLEDYQKVHDQFKPGEYISNKESALLVRNTILKYLIRRALLVSLAEKQGLKISSDEFDENFSKIQESLNATAMEDILLERKITQPQWKEELKQDFLITKFLNKQIPELTKPALQQMLLFYERHASEFHQSASAEIIIGIVPTLALAESLRNKMKGRPADLTEFIKSASLEINLEPQTVYEGTLTDELNTAIFQLRPGAVSKAIKTADGFAVISMLKLRPSLNLSFDQVKNQIQTRLLDEVRRNLVASMEENFLREATIRYNRNLIASL